MLTRYWDRRRFIRVPVHGPAWWQSGAHTGHCEIVDLSPGGAGLRMSARKGTRLADRITLAVPLALTETWLIAEQARVVRQIIDADGESCIGVEFDATGATVGRVLRRSLAALGFTPGG